jgi:hypothetical protein
MIIRGALRGPDVMADESDVNVVTADYFERRLGEECGRLRVEIINLRAEMIDRSGDLLKWLLAFFVAQTAAIGALMTALR